MKKYIPILVIIIAAISVYSLGLHKYIDLQTIQNNKLLIDEFIQNNKITFIFLYMLTFISYVALSMPAIAILTIIGGIFLGPILGPIITIISVAIGDSILFSSARMASKNLISSDWLLKLKRGFKKNAFSYLLTLRLMPIFPYFIVSLAAAMLQVPFRIFITATFIGIIPASFIYSSIGNSLAKVIDKPEFQDNIILDPTIILALFGLGALALLPPIYQKLKKKKL